MTQASAPARRGRPPKGEEKGLSTEPLPSAPVAAVGIDIGVSGFHLCVPASARVDVRDWPVWYISYEKMPDWRDRVKALIGDGTVVLAEPTGWNYLAPVAYLVARETRGEMWLIEHSRTTAVRGILNFGHKTDLMDTRAIAYAAMQLTISRLFAGCWPFDPVKNDELLRLRFLVNGHYKATADRTRFTNRLRHIGHSIAPELNQGGAWFTCMGSGAFTPEQIHALDLSGLPAVTRRAIERLRTRVPAHLFVPAPVLGALFEAWRGYTDADARIRTLNDEIVSAALAGSFADQFRKLMTFPLAAPVTCAAIIVATKGNGDQMRVPEFRSCLGVIPKLHTSGQVNKTRAARRGYKPAMKGLHMWAQGLTAAKAPDNVVRRYFAGGEKAGGKKFMATKARLALALRGVLRSEHGYDPSKMAKWIHDERAETEEIT
ncbi:MAG: transposase [Anaerolineae bacterium]